MTKKNLECYRYGIIIKFLKTRSVQPAINDLSSPVQSQVDFFYELNCSMSPNFIHSNKPSPPSSFLSLKESVQLATSNLSDPI